MRRVDAEPFDPGDSPGARRVAVCARIIRRHPCPVTFRRVQLALMLRRAEFNAVELCRAKMKTNSQRERVSK